MAMDRKARGWWFRQGRLSGLRAAARFCRKQEYSCTCGRVTSPIGIARDLEAKARREEKPEAKKVLTHWKASPVLGR